jgi:hypothetical protein
MSSEEDFEMISSSDEPVVVKHENQDSNVENYFKSDGSSGYSTMIRTPSASVQSSDPTDPVSGNSTMEATVFARSQCSDPTIDDNDQVPHNSEPDSNTSSKPSSTKNQDLYKRVVIIADKNGRQRAHTIKRGQRMDQDLAAGHVIFDGEEDDEEDLHGIVNNLPDIPQNTILSSQPDEVAEKKVHELAEKKVDPIPSQADSTPGRSTVEASTTESVVESSTADIINTPTPADNAQSSSVSSEPQFQSTNAQAVPVSASIASETQTTNAEPTLSQPLANDATEDSPSPTTNAAKPEPSSSADSEDLSDSTWRWALIPIVLAIGAAGAWMLIKKNAAR